MYQSVGYDTDSCDVRSCVREAGSDPVEKSDQALISEVNGAVLQHFIDHNLFPSSVEDLVAKGYLQEVPELESGKKITITDDGTLSFE